MIGSRVLAPKKKKKREGEKKKTDHSIEQKAKDLSRLFTEEKARTANKDENMPILTNQGNAI